MGDPPLLFTTFGGGKLGRMVMMMTTTREIAEALAAAKRDRDAAKHLMTNGARMIADLERRLEDLRRRVATAPDDYQRHEKRVSRLKQSLENVDPRYRAIRDRVRRQVAVDDVLKRLMAGDQTAMSDLEDLL